MAIVGKPSGDCDGTETFEKVSNMILEAATPIPLYSSTGNTVTAECNNRSVARSFRVSFFERVGFRSIVGRSIFVN